MFVAQPGFVLICLVAGQMGPIFNISPKKKFLSPLLGFKKIQSVAFIWVWPLLGHNKFGSKAWPLFGVWPLFIKKKLKCMLLLGVWPLLGQA